MITATQANFPELFIFLRNDGKLLHL